MMNSLRFGCSTWFFQDSLISFALQTIKECGFQAAEIWTEHLWKTGEGVQEIRSLAGTLDLPLSLHAASYDLNITSANPGIRRESLRQVRESVRLAAELDADPVVVHAGRLSSSRGDAVEYWKLLEEAFHSLDELAEEAGVTIGVEAMEKRPKEMFVSPSDIRRMMVKGWKHVGITVDLAHVQSVMEHDRFLSSMEKTWIVHAHVSDFSNDATHVPLGRGSMDIDRALRALCSCFRGTVILEGFVRGRGRETVTANGDFLRSRGWLQ
jgi:sugar phosphate isomerase/epimerase